MLAELGESQRNPSRFLAFFRSRPVFIAFASAYMADPIP